jgi:hypothetical protein
MLENLGIDGLISVVCISLVVAMCFALIVVAAVFDFFDTKTKNKNKKS